MTLLIAAMAFYIVVWIVVWCILVAEWQREFPEDGPAGGYYWASFATNGVENFWSLLKRTLLGTYPPWTRSILTATSTRPRTVSTTAR